MMSAAERRLAATSLVVLLPALVAGLALDPTRVDPGNVLPTWAASVAGRDAYPVARAFLALFAGSAVLSGVLLWRVSTQRRGPLLRWSGIGLSLAGLMVAVAIVVGTRLHGLMLEWAVEPRADIELVVRPLEAWRTAALAGGLILALIAVLVTGITVHRRSASPRWLVALPIASGLLVAASPVGFAGVTGTGGGGMIILAAAALYVWLIVNALSLVRR
jgi:hypothetical protein